MKLSYCVWWKILYGLSNFISSIQILFYNSDIILMQLNFHLAYFKAFCPPLPGLQTTVFILFFPDFSDLIRSSSPWRVQKGSAHERCDWFSLHQTAPPCPPDPPSLQSSSQNQQRTVAPSWNTTNVQTKNNNNNHISANYSKLWFLAT